MSLNNLGEVIADSKIDRQDKTNLSSNSPSAFSKSAMGL